MFTIKKRYLFLVLTVLLSNNNIFGQSKKTGKTAIINAIAHIGNGKVIENCLIIINGELIESVQSVTGIKLNYQSFDTVMDFSGKHVYPGIINCNNVLGLHDAAAVRATVDWKDVGENNAHIRTLIAYNTDNKIVPTIKTNGILYTQVTPRGGLISGNSSVMSLEGWNWEDAVLKADDGVHINFPVIKEPVQATKGEEKKQETGYKEKMQELEAFMKESYAYYQSKSASEKNLRYEAMKGVFSGSKNLYLHANNAKSIVAAIMFAKQNNVISPVIVGGKESELVAELLLENKIPVILTRVHDLPDNADDDIDAVFNLPSKLQQKGILFCLSGGGDFEMEAMNSRNLPFLAGSAVAYGLKYEDAVSLITYNVAKILKVDNKIGTLEENKFASLIVSDGDILDMKGNNITHAYIKGKAVNLSNQQTELYNKYKIKYGIK
ncbi:MAG: amidohydrolase family protein [Bacteroidia bacterium]